MLRLLLAKVLFVVLFLIVSPDIQAQSYQDRPKIVVGVVVDQMRWDYLYRYQDRYVEGGFKRMLRQGFTCENAHINYSPTATGPGHSCVYTGSVPAVHGIVGNGWYDRSIGRAVNCVEDTLVQVIGAPHSGIGRSPRNLLVTTIGDELKLANNFRSKVIGIAIKDRAAIFPAGHMSDGSYWYDNGTGRFITSSYYMENLPPWVKNFNNRKLPDQYFSETWETLYPIETYVQSTIDGKAYEGSIIDGEKSIFPYDFKLASKNYHTLTKSIYGNKLTFEMAKAAIEGEELGYGDFTDMIALSFSATDRLGHAVGPNAIEIEDMYLRLDQGFADLFHFLDERFGTNGYLFFITADHGVTQSPGFLKENKLPTSVFNHDFVQEINDYGKDKYGIDKTILAVSNYQIYLNWDKINDDGAIDANRLVEHAIRIVQKQDGVVDAWPNRELGSAPWVEPMKSRFINGYNAQRGGDISIVFRPGWKGGSDRGATHGLWYPPDAHLPLVWMGWNIPHGYTNRFIGMTDIAPTLASLLKIQMPSGSVGEPILEITDRN